jgi:hypothetical protein
MDRFICAGLEEEGPQQRILAVKHCFDVYKSRFLLSLVVTVKRLKHILCEKLGT